MPSRVLYCHCAFAQAVPRPVKQDVLRALTDRGDDFDAVADLCEMSARKDPALEKTRGKWGPYRMTGSERMTNLQLTLSRRRLRQEKIGHIGAGDQK